MSDREHIVLAIERSDGKGGWTLFRQPDITEYLSRMNPPMRARLIQQTSISTPHRAETPRDDHHGSAKVQRIANLVRLTRQLGYDDIETLVADLRDSWATFGNSTVTQPSNGDIQTQPATTAEEENPEPVEHTEAMARTSTLSESGIAATRPAESLVSSAVLRSTTGKRGVSDPDNDGETHIKAEKRTAHTNSDDVASTKRRKIHGSEPADEQESAKFQTVKHEPGIKIEESITSPRPLQYPETMIERSIIYPEEEEQVEERDSDYTYGENGSQRSIRRRRSSRGEHPRITGKRTGRPRGSRAIHYRPTIAGRYYPVPTQAEFDAMSGANKQRYSHVGRIEETAEGQVSTPCQAFRGSRTCHRYTAAAAARYNWKPSDKCAFCRFWSKPCV